MSKTFYVNLFHNGLLKYSGFKKKLEPSQKGGGHPVMLPVSTKVSKSFISTAVRFPYRLTDKNIRKFSSGKFEVAFLVPTKDVPNLTESEYRDSLYFRLAGSSDERKQELEDKVEELEDRLGKKNKKLRELRSEEEEQNKGRQKSPSVSLTCPSCGESNGKSMWESNQRQCPSCNQVFMDDPDVIRQ